MATTKKRTSTKRAKVKTACRKLVRPTGVKTDGTLKKGYKYKKGGGVVKAKAATKPKAKKRTPAKKK